MVTNHRIPFLLLAVLLLSACANTRSTVHHDDDVYFMPSQAPPVTTAKVEPTPPPSADVAPAPSDDYYDENTAQRLGTDRSYYDMAYNDPYYYNYGRFGFGMGWQSGWNGPGWGMGQGWGGPGMCWNNGWNSGWNNGWDGPWGYNNGWGWNQPYGWGGDNWGYGNYNGWGDGGYTGWGWNNWGYYGNYWSPSGPCNSCYSPIIIGGGSYVGHRTPMNRSSNGSSALVPRMVRDPISLTRPAHRQDGFRPAYNPSKPAQTTFPRERATPSRSREAQPTERSIERKPMLEPSRERQPDRNRSHERPMERSAPAPSPRDGGGSSPSRNRSR